MSPHGVLLNVLHRRDVRILSMLSSGDEQKEWSYIKLERWREPIVSVVLLVNCSFGNYFCRTKTGRKQLVIRAMNIRPPSQISILFNSWFLYLYSWMMMNLDTYMKHIHQVLYESIKILKRILIWDGGNISHIQTWPPSLLDFYSYYFMSGGCRVPWEVAPGQKLNLLRLQLSRFTFFLITVSAWLSAISDLWIFLKPQSNAVFFSGNKWQQSPGNTE